MIRNANWVETDIHQQEFPEQERYLFDLVANRGDIHKFITGNIHTGIMNWRFLC